MFYYNYRKDDVKFSSVTERSKDLYVDVCIVFTKSTFNFGSEDSLFKREILENILKTESVSKRIKEDFPPFASVEQLPKKKGLKGWQISLIAVGGVLFLTFIVGGIVYQRRKKRENQNL